jgi:hypothetical protein
VTLGLEGVVFNDFIKDGFIPEGDSQVALGSVSLPEADPVALETEEQRLEREHNERDVFEALGDYKCDAEMSVETVPAVVNIRRTIDCTQGRSWVGGQCGVECET